MSERNPTRRQYLLAASASSVALLSGCSSGGGDGPGQDEAQDATDAGDGSGQTGTQNTTADGGDSGDSSGGLTPWVSRYGDPQKTRATPDPAPSDLDSTTSYDGGGTVAVTDTGVFSLARTVIRVDPATGERAFSRSAPVGEALFVQDGFVVCGERRGGSRVGALDAETGEQAWLVEPGGAVVPFPAGDGVGYAGSHIGVLDPASGDTRWGRDRSLVSSDLAVPGYFIGNIATHPESDTAFAYNGSGEGHGIEAYDLTNGEQRWKNDESFTNTQPTPVAVRDDTVYVSRRRTNRTDQVLALDRATGDQQWAVDRSQRNAAFAVDDDRIYIAYGTTSPGTTDPTVAALDPADGSERWSSPVSRGTISLLATGDALVRIGERVEVLSKSNGELQRSAGIDGAVSDGNAVAGGRLYVTTVGGGGILVYGAG